MIRFLCLLALAVSAASAETLTVATYNVENYAAIDRWLPDGFHPAYPKPEEEKRALRAVIRRLDADVLALQEMGPKPYLEELRRDLAAEGLNYPQDAWVEGEDTVRHLALLSKRPLLAVIRHPDLEFSYLGGRERVKRGLLEVRVGTAAGELTVFVVHLKSRLTERPEDPEAANRRSAEATAVRDCILQRFPRPASARFLVLGDCNDTRSSRTLARLERRGPTVVLFRLPAADSRGETWTEVWRRQDTYTQLDHILVSAPLREAVQGRAARIYDGPDADGASDHRPLLATLEF